MKKMKPEVKEAWLNWLEDPSNKQARNCLNDGQGGRCCLGGLCDLFIRATGKGKWTEPDEEEVESAEKESIPDADQVKVFAMGSIQVFNLPPGAVTDWAGLDEENGMFRVVDVRDDDLRREIERRASWPRGEERISALSMMNDSGFTFAEIARVIREVF